jgi:hypothetical protein
MIRIVLVAGSCMATAAPAAEASYTVDHGFVPGIGRIGTTLPSDTKVRPPGYIPKTQPVTEREVNRQQRRERRINREVRPGPDHGPAAKIARIRRDLQRELFLIRVSSTVWKSALRRTHGHWRIKVDFQRFPDQGPD